MCAATLMGDEANCSYNQCFALKLHGPLAVESLRNALAVVVARHDALRLSIDIERRIAARAGRRRDSDCRSSISARSTRPSATRGSRGSSTRNAHAIRSRRSATVARAADPRSGRPSSSWFSPRITSSSTAGRRPSSSATLRKATRLTASAWRLFCRLPRRTAISSPTGKARPSPPKSTRRSNSGRRSTRTACLRSSCRSIERGRRSRRSRRADRFLRSTRRSIRPCARSPRNRARRCSSRCSPRSSCSLRGSRRPTTSSSACRWRARHCRRTAISSRTASTRFRCAVASDSRQSFAEHLRAARKSFLDAQAHPRLTFGTLVRTLKLPRDPSRTPLVSIVFNIDKLGSPFDFGEVCDRRHRCAQSVLQLRARHQRDRRRRKHSARMRLQRRSVRCHDDRALACAIPRVARARGHGSFDSAGSGVAAHASRTRHADRRRPDRELCDPRAHAARSVRAPGRRDPGRDRAQPRDGRGPAGADLCRARSRAPKPSPRICARSASVRTSWSAFAPNAMPTSSSAFWRSSRPAAPTCRSIRSIRPIASPSC